MTLRANTTDRFTVSPKAFIEHVHDEAVILDSRQELYFALNESGACIWDAIAGGETIEIAAQRLADRFGIALDLARRDTMALIQHLLEQELIEPMA